MSVVKKSNGSASISLLSGGIGILAIVAAVVLSFTSSDAVALVQVANVVALLSIGFSLFSSKNEQAKISGDFTAALQSMQSFSSGEQATYHEYATETGTEFEVAFQEFNASLKQSSDESVDLETLKRMMKSLEVCQANVMVANNDLEIVYTNHSVYSMLIDAESDIREVMPNFNARGLVGTCVDVFHVNPSHQRSLLAGLTTSYRTDLKVGKRTFGLIASPLFDDDGSRLGTVVEWMDKTVELSRLAEERRISTENARVKAALDVCQTNIMMADENYDIIYLNDSVKEMMSGNQQKLRESLPQFDASSLIGASIDTFHVNPAHQRGMLDRLVETYRTQLKVADLTFNLTATPVFDNSRNRIGTVVEWEDITVELAKQEEEAKSASDNARIKKALDACQANVMLADENFDIVYTNQSVTNMLTARESELRSVLPSFNVSSLIGTNIDGFHKDPSHQRRLVSGLSAEYQTDLKLAGLTFNLIATPVFDDEGERLGTVVEWQDKTEALAASERELVISAANARIKAGLDVCQANVMVADTDFNIVYINESLEHMLRGNQTTLRKVLPRFDIDSLIGTCMDTFHKNPSHQRRIVGDLTDSYDTRLQLGELTFALSATPVFDDDRNRVGTVVEWKDLTESLAREAEEKANSEANLRVKQALDNVTTNTMIADASNTIIYTNEALQQMMSTAESDIRKALPNFDASNLVGQCMDIFHKNPAHQTRLVDTLSSTYKTEIGVGGRTFTLVANPIVSDDGTRIGTVVEWGDRTEEVSIEREVRDLVGAASAGDLTARLITEGKDGFFLGLSTGLNQFVDICETVINDTVAMLDSMAHGNLTRRIEGDYEGTFGKLKEDANQTVSKLTEIIARINQSANTVASGSDEIAQGNADLSQRTEEQASSLEETASSMEEMTSTVKQNADNAKVANDLASEAQKKAVAGGQVVERAVASMSEINDSSKKIADIIGVIDEIAFQTNLLALNAAVEAARAGEQGRGFAVVAGEVRNLAQRSAEAAKEIKDLIRDSVTKVEDGSTLVNESGDTLTEIVAAVERVSQMIADISVASSEQSSGIEQVNKAIAQMDETTQQNAALVEEASAASESMSEQSRAMKQLLSFFTVEAGGDSRHVESIGNTEMFNQPPEPAPAPRPTGGNRNARQAQAPASLSFKSDDEDWEEF